MSYYGRTLVFMVLGHKIFFLWVRRGFGGIFTRDEGQWSFNTRTGFVMFQYKSYKVALVIVTFSVFSFLFLFCNDYLW